MRSPRCVSWSTTIPRSSSTVAGAGTGSRPCDVSTRPRPTGSGPHDHEAWRRSISHAAQTTSAIESQAPTSWKLTSSTGMPCTADSAAAEPREHVEGPGPHAGVEIGFFEQGADVAVEMMVGTGRPVVAMDIAALRERPAVPATRLAHRETRAGQRIVGVIDAFDGGDGVEPGAREGRDQRRLEPGPGVEHRRREHVARDASDGIELECAWAIL